MNRTIWKNADDVPDDKFSITFCIDNRMCFVEVTEEEFEVLEDGDDDEANDLADVIGKEVFSKNVDVKPELMN